jgi:glycine/D-amino acid oxidase-like deaminating enzyme
MNTALRGTEYGQRQRVAIIGGGVTGALSAARLAERGFAVVLVEKAGIGNGSSSRSMAGIRAQFGVEETVIGLLYSEWWYTHFHEMLATPAELRQPAIKQNGYLFLYDHPDLADAPPGAMAHWEGAKSTAAMQQRVGLSVELLSPAQIGQRWPHLAADRLIGATWCPSDGFLFPPVIYGEGIRRAEALGARILQRCEVTAARTRGGHIVQLETSGGWIDVDWVVNCTNAWAARVSARLGGMQLPISPVKHFLYHLDPGRPVLPPGRLEELPMTIYGMGRRLRAHTRPDGQHLILAGTSHTLPDPEFEDDDQDRVPRDFDHRHGIDNFGFQLLADMAPYAPSLVESAGFIATTCGYYGMTPDAVPLIGYDSRLSNLVHAAAFSGHGVMHAPISALLVEKLVTGEVGDGRVRLPAPFERHTLDLAAFDPSREFTRSGAETAVL